MLANMHDMLEDARRNHYAIGCINTPTFDLLRGIVGAAEDVGTPIVIDHAEVHDYTMPIEPIAPQMVDFARRASVPVALHVDHGVSYNFIMRCIRVGFTSVMYDLSSAPFEENVARLKEFTAMAHEAGLTVEAELGEMTSSGNDTHGGSGAPADLRDTFTDPDLARRFAEETRVDALAVCFGTVHGLYVKEPQLDIDHLKALRAAVPEETSLVMHGSSGVAPDQMTAAINNGVTKVNYYSYLSAGATQFTKELIQKTEDPVFYEYITESTTAYIRDHVRNILGILTNGVNPTIPSRPATTVFTRGS
ncbi:MAG: class II fructose-bisphosphate aldolase [Microbacterium sp.]